jgi:Rrf2 family protein
MKITSQEEYGLRCLLQLAKAGPETSLSIGDIAEREGLSTPYTAKLLSILRQEGFIDSTLGRSGGYRLAKPANQLGLGTVMHAIGERLFDEEEYCNKHAGTETAGTCVHLAGCNLRSLWQTLEGCMQHILNGLTLADLLKNDTPWQEILQQRLSALTVVEMKPLPSRREASPQQMTLRVKERIIQS